MAYKRLTDEELRRILAEMEEKGGVASSGRFAQSPKGEARYRLELQATLQNDGASDEEIQKALSGLSSEEKE